MKKITLLSFFVVSVLFMNTGLILLYKLSSSTNTTWETLAENARAVISQEAQVRI